MMNGRLSNSAAVIARGVVAGTAGGLAEIIWVSLYAGATGGNAGNLARGVTTAAGVTGLLPAAPVAAGIVVHMLLAAALGVALAFAWQALAARAYGNASRYFVVLSALVAVWAVNFFVLLPLISPPFVELVPYPVSLMSKLLFGIAAAASLRYATRERVAIARA